jgi:hypothetical protein
MSHSAQEIRRTKADASGSLPSSLVMAGNCMHGAMEEMADRKFQRRDLPSGTELIAKQGIVVAALVDLREDGNGRSTATLYTTGYYMPIGLRAEFKDALSRCGGAINAAA